MNRYGNRDNSNASGIEDGLLSVYGLCIHKYVYIYRIEYYIFYSLL